LANNKSDVDICLVLNEIGRKESEAEPTKDANIMDKLMPSPVQEKKESDSNSESTEVGIIVNYEESEAVEKSNLSTDSIATTSSNGGIDPSIPMLEMVKEVLKDYSNLIFISQVNIQFNNLLFFSGFVTHLQIIAAKVPILKFVDRISGIEVTLNVNKLVSIRNTHLIHDYTKCKFKSMHISHQIN